MTPQRITCAQCQEQLFWYVAGTLPADDIPPVAHHLTTCAACQQAYEQWHAVRDVVHVADAALPLDRDKEDTWQRLQDRQSFPLPDFDAPYPSRNSSLKEVTLMSDSANHYHTSPPRSDSSDVQRPSHRWQVLVWAVAAILLIVSIVTVFALRGSRHQSVGTHLTEVPTATPTHVPAIPTYTLPDHAMLGGSFILTPDDIWIVGYITHGDPRTVAPSGYILHYTGGRWTTVSDNDYQGTEFREIVMISPDEGWIVGKTNNGPTQAMSPPGLEHPSPKSLLLHYQHGHLTPDSQLSGTDGGIGNLRMLSPDFGYIVGPGNRVWLYQHGTWTKMAGWYNTTLDLIYLVDMLSPTEGWATDTFNVYHYTNGAWKAVLSFPPPPDIEGIVPAVRAFAPNDVWAVFFGDNLNHAKQGTTVLRSYGQIGPTPVGDSQVHFLHYDGANWKVVPLTVPNGLALDTFFSSTSGWLLLDSDPAKAPSLDTPIAAVHIANDTPTVYPIPIGTVGTLHIHATRDISPTESWAVYDLWPLQVTKQGIQRGPHTLGLLHFQQGAWSVYQGG